MNAYALACAAAGFAAVLLLLAVLYAACIVSGRISDWEDTHNVR